MVDFMIQKFLLIVSLYLFNISSAFSSQIPLRSSPEAGRYEAPTIPSKPNLVDLLAASPDHVIYVRLLQRTRLVPTLMNLLEYGDGRGLTIMAPTDEAILKRSAIDREARMAVQASSPDLHKEACLSVWEWAAILYDDEVSKDDEYLEVPMWIEEKMQLGNVNAVLRQQLLYHMINYTLPYNFSSDGRINSDPNKFERGKAKLLNTLHRPSRRLLHEPTRPGPIPHPPTSPPHPGAEDDGGLLAGEGQKMRIAIQGKDGNVYIGTDSNGSGGVKISKVDNSSSTGIILSIDGIVDLPPSLANLLKSKPSLQHLRNLTTNTLLSSLTEAAHSTFFLPTEKAFESLTPVEMTFITGDWDLARQDRLKLLGEHMSGIGLGQGRIAYAERLVEERFTNLTTIFGGQILVEADKDGKLLVEGSTIMEEDVLIENGVVHIVNDLLLPFGDLNLSVEKTLLALNASRFVSLMHTAGLERYIDASPHDADDPDHTAEPWTFMIPRDDVIEKWWKDQQDSFLVMNEKWRGGTSSSKEGVISKLKLIEILKYHIAPDQLTPSNLTNEMLIGTELRDWRLRNARQKLIVDVQDDKFGGGGSSGQEDRDIGFGDANVISKPIKVGPSIIYLVSQMLAPPSNALQIAVSSLSLSTFVAAVFSAELDRGIKETPAVTYLVPHNEAFASLGLAMQYLLLDQIRSRNDLRSVIEYHAIDEIVYFGDFTTSREYPTLEGSPIWAEKIDDKSVEIRRGTFGRNARVIKSNMLTSTGVLHEIDQVELPPTLDLTIEKLMKGAKADTMRDLMQRAGYDWILNATRPELGMREDNSEDQFSKFPHKHRKNKEKEHKKRHQLLGDWNQSYTILCPTDAAFNRINLTYYYSQPEALKALVQLHIIPSPSNQILPDGKDDLLPISMKDSSSFTTLLDATVGGISKYGKLAFRKYKPKKRKDGEGSTTSRSEDPDELGLGWIVGVADTRGTDGKSYSANVLSFGRESLSISHFASYGEHLIKKDKKGREDGEIAWNSRAVGGILTIDNVLQPYEPNWFYRWGWIALSSIFVAVILAGIGYAIWTWLHKEGRIRLPEALDGEEE